MAKKKTTLKYKGETVYIKYESDTFYLVSYIKNGDKTFCILKNKSNG